MLLLTVLRPSPGVALRTIGLSRRISASRARSSCPACSLAEERTESGKAGIVSAITGSLCAAPAALLAPDAFTAPWEFSTDALAVQLLLFGVVYRCAREPSKYPLLLCSPNSLSLSLDKASWCSFPSSFADAVRSDDNAQLKQGAAGAFLLTRTLSSARPGDQCTALPLSCGPPLGYLDWSLIKQLGFLGIESALAFGGAALVLEVCFEKGWCRRIPAGGLPTEDD
jgi:hypothetical protein